MNTGQRLKALRESKGLSQEEVAKIIGVGRTTYLKYESGENKPTRKLKELSRLFNVDANYILCMDSPITSTTQQPNSKYVRIPVLGRIVAGIPMDAVEDVIDWEEIPREMAATGEFFGLKVKGDSMAPRIQEGDVVIVKRQADVESGKVAIVLINGNEATLKRVKKQENGITLIANNISVYEPHFYTNDEIEKLPVQILGEVVELRGKNKF